MMYFTSLWCETCKEIIWGEHF